MVIESPLFMVTAGNVFLASIPFALPVVELNRPDSETAPKLAPAVNVWDNVTLVRACDKPVGGAFSATVLLPFTQVLVVAMALEAPVSPVESSISDPNTTSVSTGVTVDVPIAITFHASVNAPEHPAKALVELA